LSGGLVFDADNHSDDRYTGVAVLENDVRSKASSFASGEQTTPVVPGESDLFISDASLDIHVHEICWKVE
jgi:hypothetical protein